MKGSQAWLQVQSGPETSSRCSQLGNKSLIPGTEVVIRFYFLLDL